MVSGLTLEIHVPISATDVFLNMVHYQVRTLRAFGGRYANAKYVLMIGEPEPLPGLVARNPWLEALDVEVRWVPKERYAVDTYYATAIERFAQPFESDMVLMLDADTFIQKPFEQMVDLCAVQYCFGGCLAHISPFKTFERWEQLFDGQGLGPVNAVHEHPGWGYMFDNEPLRYCPAYFNLGVLCAPASLMAPIGEHIYDLMHFVAGIEETIYKCQLALALAVRKLNLRYEILPERFNFPNDIRMEALYGTEMNQASILHLLRDHQKITKKNLFSSLQSVEEMLARNDLRGVNQMAQKLLREVHADVVKDRQLA